MIRCIRTSVLLGSAVVLFSACGGGGGGDGNNSSVLPPTINSFSAADPDITNGESTTLAAVFQNGTGSINNGIGAIVSGSDVSVSPTIDTIYTVTVTNSAGTHATQQVGVRVYAPPSISNFTAANGTITNGQSTTLTAVFTNGTATIDNGVGTVTSGTPATVSPVADTTYTISVTNEAGTSITQQFTVTVIDPPSISSFAVNPVSIIQGESAALSASFTGGAGALDNGIGAITSGVPVTIAPTTDTTYTLTVTNSLGTSVSAQTSVTVTVVPAPTIDSFTVSEPTITSGDSTNLTAVFDNGTASIDNGVGAVTSGSTVAISPATSTTYTLAVTNSVGASITRQLNVTVVPLPSISSFTVGQSPITEGDSTTLIPMFADGSGSIDNGIGAVTSGLTVTISPAASTTYVLTVTNSLGASVSQSSSVSVVSPPSISSFDAANPTISLGSNTSLTAVFIDGTGSIDNGIGTVTSAAPVMVAPSVTTSYVLTVSNSAGAEVSQQTEIVVTGSFKRTSGDLNNGRSNHTATALDDGDVLLVGGVSPVTETAELYDSDSGSFTSVGSLPIRRFYHTATKLQDGRVLVVGGTASPPELADAALYDPSTRTFSSTGSLSTARHSHTATLLPNGKVLIVGGTDNTIYFSSAELYDPVSGTFSTTDSLADGRRAHTATLLPDGRVLIAGGYNSVEFLTSAEIYDPVTETFSSTGNMTTARQSHTSTMLMDGRLLIAGGHNRVVSNTFLDSTELYDADTGVFSASGRMSSLRAFHTATRLESGKVLVTGGNRAQNSSTVLSSAELYDPLTDSFGPTGDMNDRRYSHSATLLSDGMVLIAGGNDGNTTGLTSAELYEPVPPVAIDWEAIGGGGSFGIQAISFDPIQVDGFLSMETSGSWRNETGTTNSSLSLLIYLNIGGQWVLFAQNDSIRGPFGSVFGLDGFVFFDVDFSAGPLSGINFTNSVAGSGSYSGMTPGTTLTFRRP